VEGRQHDQYDTYSRPDRADSRIDDTDDPGRADDTDDEKVGKSRVKTPPFR
jgi:hypothetical protein